MDAPLTRFQEIIYEKVTQSTPTARFMQLAICVRIAGAHKTEVFERAAARLTARHPILCARLDFKDGRLIQREEASAPSFEVIDVGSDEAQAVAAISAQADKPMDLFRENPFKIVLGRAHSDLVFVLLLGHHVFMDEYSLQALLAEYVDLVLDPAPPGAIAPGAAPDTIAGTAAASWDSGESSFFSWCTQLDTMVHDGTLERNKRYWLEYLRGVDPVIHLHGRKDDPEFQSLVVLPFEFSAQAFQASLRRASTLGVTHFALTVSAIFFALRRATAQDTILANIIANTRRPPFDRTIGQFAEAFLLRQHSPDDPNDKLSDQDIKQVYSDVIKATRRYVSYSYFAKQLGWLQARRDKRFGASDVMVNYMLGMADVTDRKSGGQEISIVPLTGRVRPVRSTFYGLVLSFTFRPVRDSFWGYMEYESSLVDPQLAQAIISSVQDAFTHDA